MNDKPFTYTSANGTKYEAARCDLRGGITITDQVWREDQRMSDLAEMVAYHTLNIYPELNGFSGYDTLRFNLA
jgi:hypothetical protein